MFADGAVENRFDRLASLASIEACVDVDTRTRRRVSGWIDAAGQGVNRG
jgi:hypothetical protein